jgi:broad specificity phosphatase PhoE
VCCSDNIIIKTRWPAPSHTHPSLPSTPCCSCFASPHRRAAQTAELLWTPWSGSLGPVTYLDSLREADLGWFQGRRNGEEEAGR